MKWLLQITCCPSCRKALPRCAVCLGTLGTASAFSANVEQPTLKSKLGPYISRMKVLLSVPVLNTHRAT